MLDHIFMLVGSWPTTPVTHPITRHLWTCLHPYRQISTRFTAYPRIWVRQHPGGVGRPAFCAVDVSSVGAGVLVFDHVALGSLEEGGVGFSTVDADASSDGDAREAIGGQYGEVLIWRGP